MLEYSFDFGDDILQEKALSKNDEIGKAVVSAAIKMKNIARYNLKNNIHGYKLDKVADKGIILGTLKKDYKYDYNPKVKLHSLGNIEEGVLARIFVGGTVGRYTNKDRYTGYIKGTDAIASAVNQEILDNEIKKVL